MTTETLSEVCARVEAKLADMRAKGELPPKGTQSRWAVFRKAIVPDDVASVFADTWRAYTAAPLWRKPFLAIALLFGVAYHVLTAARILGMILMAAVWVVIMPVTLAITAFKALSWALALVRSAVS